MASKESDLARIFRKDARAGLEKYLPEIVRCMQLLSEKEIWWRPNNASNAAGNIVLHLCGNIRQWIISGLGGQPFVRERNKEFSERGPIPRRTLIVRLRRTVEEACEVIDRLPAEALRLPVWHRNEDPRSETPVPSAHRTALKCNVAGAADRYRDRPARPAPRCA